MKNQFVLLLLITSMTLLSQSTDLQTLRVTGEGKVTVTPDRGILSISVTEKGLEMSDAIRALGAKSNHYSDLLKKIGFAEKDIKTTNFTVSKNKIYRDRAYVDSGYIASQHIRLKFDYDQETLQRIVSAFSKSKKSIHFSFSFELSDESKQKVQAEIIEKAVRDGNEKAQTIAKAAGIKLLKIKEITHGPRDYNIGMEPVARRFSAESMMSDDNTQSFTFTPEDLVFSDSLMIIWLFE